MTMLIKAADASRSARTDAVPPVSREGEALRDAEARILELEARLAERQHAEQALRVQHERALAKAREEAFEQGRDAAQKEDAQRLTLLHDALADLRGRADARLRETERLALVVARDCLDMLFGTAGGRQDEVERLIRHQMARIDHGMVLEIRVSTADFPEEVLIQQLALRLAPGGGLSLLRDPQFKSGQCALALLLGRMEIGLDQQWPALRELLGELARPGSLAA
jgi:flagellar biosynthesis/type III secretory pathway protein FliH